MRLTLFAALLMSTSVHASSSTLLLNTVNAEQLAQIDGVASEQAKKIVLERLKAKQAIDNLVAIGAAATPRGADSKKNTYTCIHMYN